MRVLITGGAGFIGSNLAHTLLSLGAKVTIYDNLSRKNVKRNLNWLQETSIKSQLEIIISDIRDRKSLNKAIKDQDVIFHLAAQTTVTDSINHPFDDFETNVVGTINLLEGIRRYNPKAVAIYSSTNKVYGSMANLKYLQTKNRFIFKDKKYKFGIDETFPLDFYSPYACSKGAADQYFYDYGRIYGLKTIVFRQSCIYGQRQFVYEGQGWVTHFLKRIVRGEKISIYGNGKQVRDILHIDDLIDVYLRAVDKINTVAGSIYNIGGGRQNTVSLIELIKIIEKRYEIPANYSFLEARIADQKIFFSDNTKAYLEIGWEAKIGIEAGLDKLYEWVVQII